MGFHIKVELEAKDILSKVQKNVPTEKIFIFEGDLDQMATAAHVARQLGVEVEVTRGVSYVKSKADFDKVVNYIVANQIEGYWHYTK